MKRRLSAGIWICAFLLAISALWISETVSAQAAQPPGVSATFAEVMNKNPNIRVLVEKSIAQVSIFNPDRKTNPV